MPTPFSSFYEPLRSLLGDRQVQGAWNYTDEALASGLRTCFATGKAPAGLSLADDSGGAITTAAALGDATQVAQDVKLGSDMALLCWWTIKGLVVGEDGKMSVQTRSVTVRDGGDRKAELLMQIELWIREAQIDQTFDTTQRFAQWAAARVSPGDYAGLNAVTPQQYQYTL